MENGLLDKGRLYHHVALLLLSWVRDNISTVQRREINGGHKEVFEAIMCNLIGPLMGMLITKER